MHYGPLMIDIQGTALIEEERVLLKHPGVGGVLLFSRNYSDKETLKNLIVDIRESAGHSVLIAVDHEGGRVWRFREGFTRLEAAHEYGLLYDKNPNEARAWAEKNGWVMASELLTCGIDLSFAPVLDLDYGLSEVIGDRAFHRDPKVVVELAGAFIDGMHRAGMAVTGKHFPGHGGIRTDSHFKEAIDNRLLDELMKEDILPFCHLSHKLNAIMPAHVIFPNVDSVPAGFSKRWLQDILRQKLNFQGAIISDCISMKGAAMGGDFVVRSRMALDAGCDMVILAQQDRDTLLWVLDKLDRNTGTKSQTRLASLASRGTKNSNVWLQSIAGIAVP